MNLASMMVGLSFVTAQAATAGGPEGAWQGFLNPSPAAEVRLILRIEKGEGDAWKAKAEAPDLKTQPPVEFDEGSFRDGEIRLVAKEAGREFVGKLNPEGTEIVGSWKKGPVKTSLTFERVEGEVRPADIWEGSLELPGRVKLRLVFHAAKTRTASSAATLDSPDQGAYGHKVDTAEIDNGSIRFGIKAIQGDYEGKLDEAGGSASGHWKQAGTSFPLDLKKVEKASEVRRPQMPKGPFPYVSEEVAYESRAEGVRIAGTLTLPEGDGPFPAALLISGSGPQDRDETLVGHKPFLVLADDLTRRGIAVLRVDDRGFGASTGDHASATTADFAEDVRGGVDFLKGRPKIDPDRIGLIGHSEGGLIAPIVASQSDDVAFIVLMAGPGLPGDEILGTTRPDPQGFGRCPGEDPSVGRGPGPADGHRQGRRGLEGRRGEAQGRYGRDHQIAARRGARGPREIGPQQFAGLPAGDSLVPLFPGLRPPTDPGPGPLPGPGGDRREGSAGPQQGESPGGREGGPTRAGTTRSPPASCPGSTISSRRPRPGPPRNTRRSRRRSTRPPSS